ncbi:MAG: cobalt transporter CbiM [Desulfomonilaceae bacterium]
MHISEGILGTPVLAAGAALTVVGTSLGLKKMEYEKLPAVALLSSVFFLASLVHVPIGPAAAHLVLTGLCGILLGWCAFPAILVGVSSQAILFQFGGLTTLGVNTFNMAFPAVIMSYICCRGIRSSSHLVRIVFKFLAGAGAILLAATLVALSLTASGESFRTVSWLIVAAHIPIMVMEGVITVFAVEFLRRIRPEALSG